MTRTQPAWWARLFIVGEHRAGYVVPVVVPLFGIAAWIRVPDDPGRPSVC